MPVDDGAADHLRGATMPRLALPATSGGTLPVGRPPPGFARLVLYAYPRTGPADGSALTGDWDAIPGARGCTPEACGFRDHAADMGALGAAVAGVSTQDTAYQSEAADRLGLGSRCCRTRTAGSRPRWHCRRSRQAGSCCCDG